MRAWSPGRSSPSMGDGRCRTPSRCGPRNSEIGRGTGPSPRRVPCARAGGERLPARAGGRMRLLRLAALVIVAVLAIAVAPASALAADPITVSGTVVRDGVPVTAAKVVVSVTGGDQLASASTDEQGAFSVQVEAEVGSELRIEATGQTSRSDPDAANCVHSETPTGSLTTTIEALPLDHVEVAMDDVITSKVCGPTATPGITRPGITPPSTDVARPGTTGTAPSALL